MEDLSFDDVRRIAITAMFSDDMLLDCLALKGGAALRYVHGGPRASIDLDFSIREDFESPDQVRRLVLDALEDRFDSEGYVLFDQRFRTVPPDSPDVPEFSGGYEFEFKLIPKERWSQLGGRLDAVRRQASVVAPHQGRTFRIQLSRHEVIDAALQTELDEFTIRVYTLEMIAIEKLRAICQQMPEYPYRPQRTKTQRARDFYDICVIVDDYGVVVDTPACVDLLKAIFEAKAVPIDYLGRIESHREFHRPGWPAVVNTVEVEIEDFEVYFDSVVALGKRLQARGNV